MLLFSVRVADECQTAFVSGVSNLGHSKRMWDDGVRLKATLFARPAASSTANHIARRPGTAILFERFNTSPPAAVDQLVLGSPFSFSHSPVQFGSDQDSMDSDEVSASGDDNQSHRRRRSRQCLGCGEYFGSDQALFAHEGLCVAVPEMPDQSVAEDESGSLEEGVQRIQLGLAEECSEMKHGGYGSNADVQRSKQAVKRVSDAQRQVLLAELAKRDLTGDDWETDFADIIKTVMGATDSLMGKNAEYRLLNQQQPYQVEPVCVRHDIPSQTVQVGNRDVPVNKPCEQWNIPIEQSWQRHLFYDPAFAEHFVDWGQLPRSPEGTYASIQDGLAARNHPELGNTSYVGPSRLAGGHYFDDLETTLPIGANHAKHDIHGRPCQTWPNMAKHGQTWPNMANHEFDEMPL